ncbi:glutamine ABC transporter substrate-binding protein [Virgibacillus profundi]|uniref:Glutamine ABC transporter substrate-binding protein n=1 Tax=Virgibacillus profundi TaxID=2024555 RepID=A0A2A2I8L0_9BACI|nr:transporter substrate-binding domain-containing protein [Virgibacillus profundi]PAV27718.1 glutamine ABC transporter substrate-binding protein [Virgibacillus profundi]PXY51873.1 glutamine ABC transporter substrate-binding protein [Virgibacillus profundi]
MRKFSLFSLFLVLVLALAACGSDDTDATETSGEGGDSNVYTVGVDTTYPPFEFQEDGELVGIDIDLINAIAEDQGFEIDIQSMDFSGIIPAMQAGELDIGMGGMSITEERKETVDFSDPYFESGLTLVTAAGNSDISSIDDMEGKTIVVKNGTTGAKFAADNQDEYGYEIVQVNDSTAMFQEVGNGSADALIEDYPVIAYAIEKSSLDLQISGDKLNGDNYGMSVLKGENDELLKKINDGLASLKESGKYDEILNKYLGE